LKRQESVLLAELQSYDPELFERYSQLLAKLQRQPADPFQHLGTSSPSRAQIQYLMSEMDEVLDTI